MVEVWWGARRRVLESHTHHIPHLPVPYPLQTPHITLPELSDPDSVLAITASILHIQHTALSPINHHFLITFTNNRVLPTTDAPDTMIV